MNYWLIKLKLFNRTRNFTALIPMIDSLPIAIGKSEERMLKFYSDIERHHIVVDEVKTITLHYVGIYGE